MAVSTTQVEAREAKKEEYERPWLEILKRFTRHRFAVGSVIVLFLVVLAVIVGPFLMPFGETDSAIVKKNHLARLIRCPKTFSIMGLAAKFARPRVLS